MKRCFVFLFVQFFCVMHFTIIQGQNVGINSTGAMADPSAMLDVSSTNTGLLIPRIALTSADISTPVITPTTSLLVYNTSTSGASPNNVSPGYYYWNGISWTKLNGNDWSINGNSNTIDGTHFIGTTDNIPLNFKVNNQKAGRIDPILNNTFLGYQSGNVTTGIENTAMGYRSLFSNTTGAGNVANGYLALNSNTIGYNNIAIGSNAMFSNISGYNNIAIGFQSLSSNTSGVENTAVGFRSLFANAGGAGNVANGFLALHSNTAGFNNIAVGSNALYSNMTGGNNIGIGFQALYLNTIGFNNVANGAYSLYFNTIGNDNVSSGNYSLYSNTSGNNNTATGIGALQFNTTGQQNTAVGGYSLYSYANGNYNTALGYIAFNSGPTVNNSTALGYGAFITTSNEVKVGNPSITSIGGQVGWTTISDKRIKENVQHNVPGLEFIMRLEPVTYQYNLNDQYKILEAKNESEYPQKNDISKMIFTGFLAQDVDSVASQLGYNFSGVDKSGSLWGLRYAEFVVPLVKAVQEQQQIITTQNDLLYHQQMLIESFEKRLQQIEQKIR